MTHLLEGAHIQLNGRSQGEERRFVDALGSRGRVLLVTGERALQAALDAAAAKNAADADADGDGIVTADEILSDALAGPLRGALARLGAGVAIASEAGSSAAGDSCAEAGVVAPSLTLTSTVTGPVWSPTAPGAIHATIVDEIQDTACPPTATVPNLHCTSPAL